MSDDDLLSEAKEAFELCADAESENRIAALDDMRFSRLGEQWPDKVRKDREKDNRPCLTINRLPSFTRQVVNDSRQNKPAIKVRPVDSGADPITAEIYNGLIRNIEQISNADVAYDTAIESAVNGGFGYFRIKVDYSHDDTFERDILIDRIANPFSVFGDPYSTAADSSDWNVAFVTDSIPLKVFKEKYSGAEPADWETSGYGNLTAPWFEDERILLAEWWAREEVSKEIIMLSDGTVIEADVYERERDIFDAVQVQPVEGKSRTVKSWKVKQRLMTGAEILEDNDWAGRYIPLIPVYGDEVNIEGKRYFRSLIRDAKDAQQMFNYWRTASTELVALAPKAPWIGEEGAFDVDDRWSTANTANHSYLEYAQGKQPPQRQPFAGVPAGALQEALNASDDMKSIIGMYDASLGARSNETSGKAIVARQREGDTSTFHFIDNLSRAIRHAGRVIIDLIPSVYNGPRIVRVLGPDNIPKNVAVNQPADPKTGEAMPQAAGPDGSILPGPDGKPMARVFDLTAGKYDLVVEAGPSYSTKREEAANQMVELMRVFPQAAPVIGDMLAKNLDWPGAEEISRRLKALLPPQLQGQGQDPATQKLMADNQQLQQMVGQLKQSLESLKTQAQNDMAGTVVDAEKAKTDRYKAETDRMSAIVAAMQALGPGGMPFAAASAQQQVPQIGEPVPTLPPGAGMPMQPPISPNVMPGAPPQMMPPPGTPQPSIPQPASPAGFSLQP